MVNRRFMMRKSGDNDIKLARKRLLSIYGNTIKRIQFGKIRKDGTRYAKLHFKDRKILTYSYLTDIPRG